METLYKKKPLYVAREITDEESIKHLRQFAVKLGLPKVVSDLHMTVMYSTAEMNWHELDKDEKTLKISFDKLEVFPMQNGGKAIVLKVKKYDYLQDRWQYYMDKGASYDYPEYKPHVTLAYTDGDIEVDLDMEFEHKVKLGPEYFDDILDTRNFDPEDSQDDIESVEEMLETVPEGVLAEDWKYMTKEQRLLWY